MTDKAYEDLPHGHHEKHHRTSEKLREDARDVKETAEQKAHEATVAAKEKWHDVGTKAHDLKEDIK